MKVVKIFGLGSDANDKEIGRLILREGKITPDPVDNVTLLNLLKEEILDPESREVISPETDPESFLENLHRRYRSAYLRATEVEESASMPMVKPSPFAERKSLRFPSVKASSLPLGQGYEHLDDPDVIQLSSSLDQAQEYLWDAQERLRGGEDAFADLDEAEREAERLEREYGEVVHRARMRMGLKSLRYRTKTVQKGTCKPGQNPERDQCQAATDVPSAESPPAQQQGSQPRPQQSRSERRKARSMGAKKRVTKTVEQRRKAKEGKRKIAVAMKKISKDTISKMHEAGKGLADKHASVGAKLQVMKDNVVDSVLALIPERLKSERVKKAAATIKRNAEEEINSFAKSGNTPTPFTWRIAREIVSHLYPAARSLLKTVMKGKDSPPQSEEGNEGDMSNKSLSVKVKGHWVTMGSHSSEDSEEVVPPTVPESPLEKRLNRRIKAMEDSSGTCKQGERSDLTGCTPASGQVSAKKEGKKEDKKTEKRPHKTEKSDRSLDKKQRRAAVKDYLKQNTPEVKKIKKEGKGVVARMKKVFDIVRERGQAAVDKANKVVITTSHFLDKVGKWLGGKAGLSHEDIEGVVDVVKDSINEVLLGEDYDIPEDPSGMGLQIAYNLIPDGVAWLWRLTRIATTGVDPRNVPVGKAKKKSLPEGLDVGALASLFAAMVEEMMEQGVKPKITDKSDIEKLLKKKLSSPGDRGEKTLSWLDNGRGGALVPPPKQGKFISPFRAKKAFMRKPVHMDKDVDHVLQMYLQGSITRTEAFQRLTWQCGLGKVQADREIDRVVNRYERGIKGLSSPSVKPSSFTSRGEQEPDRAVMMADILAGVFGNKVDQVTEEKRLTPSGMLKAFGKSLTPPFVKGVEKGTCKQGERSDLTGCTPASGKGGKKEGGKKKETSGGVDKGESETASAGGGKMKWDKAGENYFRSSDGLMSIQKEKVGGQSVWSVRGRGKREYANTLGQAKKIAEGFVPEGERSAPKKTEKPTASSVKQKLDAAKAAGKLTPDTFDSLITEMGKMSVAELKKLRDAVGAKGGSKKTELVHKIRNEIGGISYDASGRESVPSKLSGNEKPPDVEVADDDWREDLTNAEQRSLGEASFLVSDGKLNREQAIKFVMNNAHIPQERAEEWYNGLSESIDIPTPEQESSPQPPSPGFSGKDASGHCWDNGKMVPCPEEKVSASEMNNTVRDSYEHLKLFREFEDGLVEIPRLWKEVQKRDPNVSKEDFKQFLLDARKSGLDLMVLNEVHKVPPEELSNAINVGTPQDPRFLYYLIPHKGKEWPKEVEAKAKEKDKESSVKKQNREPTLDEVKVQLKDTPRDDLVSMLRKIAPNIDGGVIAWDKHASPDEITDEIVKRATSESIQEAIRTGDPAVIEINTIREPTPDEVKAVHNPETGRQSAIDAVKKVGLWTRIKEARFPLDDDDLEKLSDLVHDSWMKRESSLSNGGRESRRYLMVPYKDLSEADKEKDRAFVREVVASLRPPEYWGSKQQPFYRPGANPTVDSVVTRMKDGKKQVLLIRRKEGGAEGGKWALPGGFVNTDAKKGEPWKPGKELQPDAALRELTEESGLDVNSIKHDLRHVGKFDTRGRDPRDNAESWAVTDAFSVELPPDMADAYIEGRDDADRAEWVDVDKVGERNLAFDHRDILKKAGIVGKEKSPKSPAVKKKVKK